MKIAANIAGGLLGLLFVAFGLMFLLKMVPDQPAPPEGSAIAHFMAAFAPTGYMAFVKVCEVLGGMLVAIPRTRNWGLLVLGPIIINILAFHVFVAGGGSVFDPMLIAIVVLTLFLLWAGRHAFLGLLNRS